MTLSEQVNEGIKEAMRSRDMVRLGALRMLKSKILAVDARGNLPDAEVVKLFKTYQGNLTEALEIATTAGRTETAEQLKAEMAVVQEFLPKPLSVEETEELVKEAIAETEAKSKKDFGLVMKAVMKKNSSADGKLVKQLAEQFLV